MVSFWRVQREPKSTDKSFSAPAFGGGCRTLLCGTLLCDTNMYYEESV
jgi:hypothetical protein